MDMTEMDEPGVALGALDPAAQDPRYWERFQARVMLAAAPELRRRRARGEVVTVTDVVLSWGRMLVPTALAAAVAAGLLITPRTPEPEMLGLEETLQALVDEPVPDLLHFDEPDASLVRVSLEGG
jgi:hypothetical protein